MALCFYTFEMYRAHTNKAGAKCSSAHYTTSFHASQCSCSSSVYKAIIGLHGLEQHLGLDFKVTCLITCLVLYCIESNS